MGRTSSTVKDRYNRKAYDELKIRLKKGEKGQVEAYAKELGLSVNGFITGLIHERMNLTAPEEAADEEQT